MTVHAVPAPTPALENISEIAADVVRKEANALLQLSEAMPQGVEDAVRLISQAPGRVIVSGMGKSGHVGRKIAATLASTGTPAQFVHPAEASHGDLGMLTKEDLCLVLSHSGESRELADLLAHAKRFEIPVIAITREPRSALARQADLVLQLPCAPEACSIGVVPTTSTTATLALGDALAVCLMQLHGFDHARFLTFHPGGKLGAMLLSVEQLMRSGDDMPVVKPDTPMDDTLLVMTGKGLGIAVVADGPRLIGVITDGDLRRNLPALLERLAGDVCTRNPKTIRRDRLASEALRLMNDAKINVLCVADNQGRIEGVLHVHDCLSAGVE